MIISKIVHFLDYNFNFHIVIDIYSNNDNMHRNGMFYALICINNHKISCINWMLLTNKVRRNFKRTISSWDWDKGFGYHV